MKVLIVCPAPRGSTKGNRITAERWAAIFRQLHYQVRIVEAEKFDVDAAADCNVMVAIHARRSHTPIKTFRRHFPQRSLVVCLSGTDLHRDILQRQSKSAMHSLDLADRLVLLETQSRQLLKPAWRSKATVIFQSAVRVRNPEKPLKRAFEVSVIGHLRPVKDPFLAARATRRLPTDSRIRVIQIGEALTLNMERLATQYSEKLERYQWLRRRSHGQTQHRLARSRLTILSSKMEGGPSVICEAVVNDVPVLSTRITAAIGMLGADHPGLYPVGDTKALAELMYRSETDRDFYQALIFAGRAVRERFDPRTEASKWKALISELVDWI